MWLDSVEFYSKLKKWDSRYKRKKRDAYWQVGIPLVHVNKIIDQETKLFL